MTELARLRAAIYDDEERQSLGIDRVKAIEARIAELEKPLVITGLLGEDGQWQYGTNEDEI